MCKKAIRLTSSRQTEAAGIRLFNQIDRGVGRYVRSAENLLLREQALRNAVGMLEILKKMYQVDLRQRSLKRFPGEITVPEHLRLHPEDRSQVRQSA